jgi:hypothetical protein
MGGAEDPWMTTEHLCIAAECDSRRRMTGMLSSHIGDFWAQKSTRRPEETAFINVPKSPEIRKVLAQ